jgi:hypothetical protein
MCNSTRSVARVLLLGVTLFGAGWARAQTVPSANIAPYTHVYTQSQALFDRCNDTVRGDLYRRVLTEKMKGCPFSAAEKAEFQAWAVSESARIAEENRQAHAAGPVPAAADDAWCKQGDAEPYMRFVRRRIDQFGQGRINADGVIEEVCTKMQP